MVSLGLIGKKLTHSWSAKYFTDKFAKEGIEGAYSLFPLADVEELPVLIESHSDLMGLNVTIPYKESVTPFLDSISRDAEKIGAVNVIKIVRDKNGKAHLAGHNSDWEAFRESICPLLANGARTALILGTGGASRAVAYALSSLGISARFVSRNHKADKPEIKTYSELTEEDIRKCLIIVNTTPLGMYPDTGSCPDIPYNALTSEHLCYDLVYNPEETEFLRLCAAKGAKVKNGLEMLHRQADLSWQIWSDQQNSD